MITYRSLLLDLVVITLCARHNGAIRTKERQNPAPNIVTVEDGTPAGDSMKKRYILKVKIEVYVYSPDISVSSADFYIIYPQV